MLEQGLIHVYTGEGKGKTTASVGLAVRARSRGLRVLYAQFMKSREGGETELLAKLGVEVMRFHHVLSPRFHPHVPLDEIREAARRAFAELAPRIESGYDLVVLDEFNCLLAADIITLGHAIEFIGKKGPHTELVLTGRGAPKELIASADLVTEMRESKHPYNDNVAARPGIEF